MTILKSPVPGFTDLWNRLQSGEGRGTIWGRSMGMVKGEENKDYKLNAFNLFSLPKERFRDDIITLSKYLHEEKNIW